jgi:formylmethanofuran dehydrogenase subunit B
MNPGETSSVDLANRGEVDAFINIGTDAGAHFPIRAFEKLGSGMPMVTIDPSVNMAATVSDVHIPVAIVGVETGGICYRMDNVPIQYRAVVPPYNGILTDEELFDRIYERMQELKKEGFTTDEGVWDYATPLADVRPVKEVYE